LHLHVAANGDIKQLEAALDDGVNVNLQDYESGYTALHKVFYDGNILMAVAILRRNPDLYIKDKEGNNPIDLLYSTIKTHARLRMPASSKRLMPDSDNEDDEYDEGAIPSAESSFIASGAPELSSLTPTWEFTELPPSMSLWTWGSNSNFNIGHSSSGVESLDVTKSFEFPVTLSSLATWDAQIRSVAMSKYHTCILTRDRLFTFGFGAGGRLGHGNEETKLTPTPVGKLMGKLEFVAAGPDNTLVINERGNLYSWGKNEYLTLGYPIESDMQLTPQAVVIKATVVGAACSKYHAACFTSSGSIYTWGTNNGQLGYNGKAQVHPRKVTSFPQQDILQICVTNASTAVLCKDQVHVFSNGDVQRVMYFA
jgi:Regulator of chromosome condensation (RCC1) repeat